MYSISVCLFLSLDLLTGTVCTSESNENHSQTHTWPTKLIPILIIEIWASWLRLHCGSISVPEMLDGRCSGESVTLQKLFYIMIYMSKNLKCGIRKLCGKCSFPFKLLRRWNDWWTKKLQFEATCHVQKHSVPAPPVLSAFWHFPVASE